MKLTGKQVLFLVTLAAAAVIILIIVALLVPSGQGNTTAALPTAAVLPTLQGQNAPETARPVISETASPTAAQPTFSTAAVLTPTVSQPAENITPTASALSATPAPAQTQANLPPEPSASITPVQPIAPTTAVSPAVLTPVPPTPTAAVTLAVTLFPTPENLIALGEAVNIGGGELRVLQLHRPADALLREMTGSLPPAPIGQRWAAVELLLICSGETNCTPTPDDFILKSASGAEYAANRTTGLQPYFAPETYLIGQTWGYLLFAVPQDESVLWLELTTSAQTYLFGLG